MLYYKNQRNHEVLSLWLHFFCFFVDIRSIMLRVFIFMENSLAYFLSKGNCSCGTSSDDSKNLLHRTGLRWRYTHVPIKIAQRRLPRLHHFVAIALGPVPKSLPRIYTCNKIFRSRIAIPRTIHWQNTWDGRCWSEMKKSLWPWRNNRSRWELFQ